MGWLGDIGVAMKRFLVLALVPALAGCTKMGPEFDTAKSMCASFQEEARSKARKQ